MKKNILYIIFFMVLVACKREAVFELEGYSGQILRDRTVGLRYPTAPGRQYFLSTQADSGDYFFLTGEITPGKVTFLDFGYQHLPLYVEKQHYRSRSSSLSTSFPAVSIARSKVASVKGLGGCVHFSFKSGM